MLLLPIRKTSFFTGPYICPLDVCLSSSSSLSLSVVVAPKNKSEGPNQAHPMFNRLSKSLVNWFPQRDNERTREPYYVVLCSALSCAVIKDLLGLIEPSTLTNRWAINLTRSQREREKPRGDKQGTTTTTEEKEWLLRERGREKSSSPQLTGFYRRSSSSPPRHCC
jgi:hypothetical protein